MHCSTSHQAVNYYTGNKASLHATHYCTQASLRVCPSRPCVFVNRKKARHRRYTLPNHGIRIVPGLEVIVIFGPTPGTDLVFTGPMEVCSGKNQKNAKEILVAQWSCQPPECHCFCVTIVCVSVGLSETVFLYLNFSINS